MFPDFSGGGRAPTAVSAASRGTVAKAGGGVGVGNDSVDEEPFVPVGGGKAALGRAPGGERYVHGQVPEDVRVDHRPVLGWGSCGGDHQSS